MKGATFLEEKLSVLWWADEAYHQQKKINCWGLIQLDLSYSDILIILELWLHLMITLRLQVQWVILKSKLKWCQIVTVKQWQSNIRGNGVNTFWWSNRQMIWMGMTWINDRRTPRALHLLIRCLIYTSSTAEGSIQSRTSQIDGKGREKLWSCTVSWSASNSSWQMCIHIYNTVPELSM